MSEISERSMFPIWWESRTPRERVLLGVLAVLIATIAFWYGLVQPLRRAEADARERHERAIGRLLAVSASAREIEALQTAGAQGPSGRVLADTVGRAALAHGIVLSQQTMIANGDLAVTVATADPASAFRWIAALQRDHDLTIATLALTRNPDRTLQLQARFTGGSAP